MTKPWPARLLVAYPPGWRARYGDEIDLLINDLCEDGRRPIPIAIDLISGAAAAWCGIRRGLAMSERSRNALITVLWSWVAFAATAAWFGHDLAIYPSRSAAPMFGRAHPVVPDAYHVLLAAGIVGVAATAVAAVPFAIEAARFARAGRRYSTFALMAIPPVVAAAWIGGLPNTIKPGSAAGTALSLGWLLLGLAGIAGSTQAVCAIIRRSEFSAAVWRIGAVAATTVTSAMLVATGSTIVWGIASRSVQPHPGDASGWIAVTAIMAVTTGRAAIALIGSRREASPEAVVA